MAENSHCETQFNVIQQSLKSIYYESTKSLNQNLTFITQRTTSSDPDWLLMKYTEHNGIEERQ